MKRISVSLKHRSYDILVGRGILSEAGKKLKALGVGQKVLIVSNRRVAREAGFLSKLAKSLAASGFKWFYHELRFGDERDKSEKELLKLWAHMVRIGLDRTSTVVALGGGVVGDVSGFGASTYMRGINVVQVPTTLLAQVDSAIGGKTGIDFLGTKNVVGSFHQPRLVISDLNTIAKFPLKYFQHSFAEVIKYGVIRDPGLFVMLERYGKIFLAHAKAEMLASKDFGFLEEVVLRCAKVKAKIVEADERETKGLRMILNNGHTFAHALEGMSNYRLAHGPAVALGMALAARLSERLGLVNSNFVSRQNRLIQTCGLPADLKPFAEKFRISWDRFSTLLHRDKKSVGKTVRFILPVGVGKVEVKVFNNNQLKPVRSLLKEFGVN